MVETLVIGGAGYVGRALAASLPSRDAVVVTTSRVPGRADVVLRSGADLDALLATRHFGQIVHLPQLASPDGDRFLDRVDGPRWLVFSSAQVASSVPGPGTDRAVAREEVALARGATVLRPTMIFGRGGDANISRVIRLLRRYRVPIVIGGGSQLVQPVHVDDLVELVTIHGRRPVPGPFAAGGDDRITSRDLVASLRRHLGLRLPVISVPVAGLRVAAALPLPGLRRDQVLRLQEDKVVDISPTCEAFAWSPRPLADRIAQAVAEAMDDLGGTVVGTDSRRSDG